MKCFSVVTLAAVVSLGLTACNSGASRRTGGKQCPSNYAVSMKPAAGQTQISLNPADKQLIPGIYTYQGATAYYKDKATDFALEITDAKDAKTQQFKASGTCVRNARPGLNIGFRTQGISKLEVGAAPELKTFFDTREITFTVAAKLTVAGKNGSQKVDNIPEKAYEGVANMGIVMIKKSAVDFEIRSHYADGQGEHYLIVRLKRANLPAQPAPAPAAPKP